MMNDEVGSRANSEISHNNPVKEDFKAGVKCRLRFRGASKV